MTNSWYRQHRTRPCKERKDGAPRVLEREKEKKRDGRAGHPPNNTVVADQAYTPYGEIYNIFGANNAEYQVFAGMIADLAGSTTTPIMWDTPNRELSYAGRWLSPDPLELGAFDPTNSKNWNRYAYALNNPLRYKDPLGLYCFYGGAGDTPENDSDSSDFNFDEHGLEGMSDCASEGGTWEQDSTEVTVNGDNPDDVTTTTENGEQIFPETVPLQQTYANCVKNGGNYFSLANGLNYLTRGSTSSGLVGAVNQAFLGNSVSDVIGLAQGDVGDYAMGKLIEKGAPKTAQVLASAVPNITVSGSTVTNVALISPDLSVSLSVVKNTKTTIQLGTAAQASSNLLTKGLETFSRTVKLPIDLATASFSALVCGVGR